jgi:hypothetical protein
MDHILNSGIEWAFDECIQAETEQAALVRSERAAYLQSIGVVVMAMPINPIDFAIWHKVKCQHLGECRYVHPQFMTGQ